RALVVEDEAALHMLYGQILKNANFEVLKAWNGRDAIDYLENNAIPKLIVLDIRMPESNGLEVLQYLQSHPHVKDTHVVIATATNKAAEYVDMLPSAEIIYKPLVLPALREVASRFSEV